VLEVSVRASACWRERGEEASGVRAVLRLYGAISPCPLLDLTTVGAEPGQDLPNEGPPGCLVTRRHGSRERPAGHLVTGRGHVGRGLVLRSAGRCVTLPLLVVRSARTGSGRRALIPRRLAPLPPIFAGYSRLMHETSRHVRDLRPSERDPPLIGRARWRSSHRRMAHGRVSPSVIRRTECEVGIQTVMTTATWRCRESAACGFGIGINRGDVIHRRPRLR